MRKPENLSQTTFVDEPPHTTSFASTDCRRAGCSHVQVQRPKGIHRVHPDAWRGDDVGYLHPDACDAYVTSLWVKDM